MSQAVRCLMLSVVFGLVGVVPAEAPSGADQYGDPMPPRAVARMGTMRFRHADSIASAAFAPDGTVLASAGLDNLIRLWDVRSRKELRRFTGHTNGVTSVAFAPDGRTLVSAGRDETIRLWDPASGREWLCLREHRSDVRCVTFSPDSRLLAAADENDTIRLWNPATGRPIWKLTGFGKWIRTLAFSADGKTLAAGGIDGQVHLAEVATGKFLWHCRAHQYHAASVLFTPDGKAILSAGWDNRIMLLDGKERLRLPWPDEGLCALAFSPDGKVLATGASVGGELIRLRGQRHLWMARHARPHWQGAILLRDAATGKVLRRLTGHENAIQSLGFSAEGKRLVSGSADDTIRVWVVTSGKELNCFGRGLESAAEVALSPDGRTAAAAGADCSVHLWEVATGKERCCFRGHQGRVTGLVFTLDSRRLISTSTDTTALVWDVTRPPTKPASTR